ncbi:MAG: hypothetical protein LQ351_003736 [Letrouitia transgressa]|nr:MAG: hypothetical protein LQ351_003736 [Letrouitia transgressa]
MAHQAPPLYGDALLDQQSSSKAISKAQILSLSCLDNIPRGMGELTMDFGNGAYAHHSNLVPSSVFSPNNTNLFWSELAKTDFVSQKGRECNEPLNTDNDIKSELQEIDENSEDYNMSDEETSEDDKENKAGIRDISQSSLISHRQQKKLYKEEQGFQLAKDHRVKGMTRWTKHDGFQILMNEVWYPATRHEWHRVRIIAEAAREGQYLYEPVRGAHDLDQTAFHLPDRELDVVVRERRPALLHQWHPVGDIPPFKHPGFMKIENAIVIDHANQPVRDWPELPKAISGQCEGLRMEYWRRMNRHITVNDIRARMPRMTNGRANLKLKELSVSSFGNRMDRGRTKGACVAWNHREGTLVKEREMLKLMPSDVRRQVLETNSTAHWRDLNNQEVKRILEANKGKSSFMKRASWRALSPATRARRQAAALALQARKDDAKVSAITENAEMVLSSESDKGLLGRQSNASRDHHAKYPRNASHLSKSLHSSQLLSPHFERSESQTAKQTQKSIKIDKPLPRYKMESNRGAEGEKCLEEVEVEVGKPEVADYQHLLTTEQKSQPESFEDESGDDGFDSDEILEELKYLPLMKTSKGVDQRLRAPSTDEEKASLAEALEITLKNIKKLLQYRSILPTNKSQSYMFQHAQLQDYLDCNYPGDCEPKLVILNPWFGAIENWRKYNPDAAPAEGTTAKLSSDNKRAASEEQENAPKKQKIEEGEPEEQDSEE